MFKFMQRQKNLLFTEMLGSFSYVFPKNRSEQMYDFYMLGMLLGRSSFEMKRNNIIAQGGPDPYSLGGPRSMDNRDWTNEDKIDHMLEEVANELLPKLKEQLLKETMYAIAAEVRHVFARNDPADILNDINVDMGQRYGNIFKRYIKEFVINSSPNRSLLKNIDRNPVRILRGEESSPKEGYKHSYVAIKKSGGSPEEWANLAKYLFATLHWNDSFGGGAWADIADGWLTLNKAQKRQDIIKYIDHIYDLEHNTGSVFTKLASYKDANLTGNAYDWIKKALDKKSQIENPMEIVKHVSPSFRKLALRAIKEKWGTSLEDVGKAKKKFEPDDQIKESEVFNKFLKASTETDPTIALARVAASQCYMLYDADNTHLRRIVDDTIKIVTKYGGGHDFDKVVEIAYNTFANMKNYKNNWKSNEYTRILSNFDKKKARELISKFSPTFMPTSIHNSIAALLKKKQLINAVKEFRSYTSYPLVISKCYVERFHLWLHTEDLCDCNSDDQDKANQYLNSDQVKDVIKHVSMGTNNPYVIAVRLANVLNWTEPVLDKMFDIPDQHLLENVKKLEKMTIHFFATHVSIYNHLTLTTDQANVILKNYYDNMPKEVSEYVAHVGFSANILYSVKNKLGSGQVGPATDFIQNVTRWSMSASTGMIDWYHLFLHKQQLCNCNSKQKPLHK